jgi:probable rRNA maturation factor
MSIIFEIDDPRWEKFLPDLEKITQHVMSDDGIITCILTTSLEELNEKYRKKIGSTNVLSFPYEKMLNDSEEEWHRGDVFVSFNDVEKESKDQGKTFLDHAIHISLHGILHILGFDHINKDDEILMKNEEIKILSLLLIKNPYSNEHD